MEKERLHKKLKEMNKIEITVNWMEGSNEALEIYKTPRIFDNYSDFNNFIISALGVKEHEWYDKVSYTIKKGEIEIKGRLDYHGFRLFLLQAELVLLLRYHWKQGKITEEQYNEILKELELSDWMRNYA